MNITLPASPDHLGEAENTSGVNSLKELIEMVTRLRDPGDYQPSAPQETTTGILDRPPYPFLAIVGQKEMKLALLLALVNPAVGGVLLAGARGTGKTTAARGLLDLLPDTLQSLCRYGCLEEDLEQGGMDAVCPDCARRYGEGLPLAVKRRVRLVELPLNSRLADVTGEAEKSEGDAQPWRWKKGILSQADGNILYTDEVNLLPTELASSLLDAAGAGSYSVRRGGQSFVYRSRFALVGSMNPEEGQLRPQLLDRFGLRVVVQGLTLEEQRLEVYQRVQAYQQQPNDFAARYAPENSLARQEISAAQALLPRVTIPDQIARRALTWIKQLQIHSLRAEISLFESARALAAIEGRQLVTVQDLQEVAPMALRMRRSLFLEDFFAREQSERERLSAIFHAS